MDYEAIMDAAKVSIDVANCSDATQTNANKQ